MARLPEPDFTKIFSENEADSDNLQAVCDFLQENVEHYDWVGFYIVNKPEQVLELGPFAGEPTDHKVIPFGKGVCGQSAEKEENIVVSDVSKLNNYLSCSLYVKSEIVVPVFNDGKYVAQIDIDSHQLNPFTKKDEEYLENICLSVKHLFN
ncbi:MAG TPA: GAF domain-containing protein [bacterium]|nr:GAF domain-containing protein [bacterium]